MALARRRPGPGLIHHSDQGSQYVSLAFGRAARQAGIAISMGSRGDAYDNAVAETFFATLKKELVNRRSWPSRLELQSAVFEYIEAFYNRQRRHSTLGMLSPAEYEQTPDNEPHPCNIKQQQQLPNQPRVVQTGAGPDCALPLCATGDSGQQPYSAPLDDTTTGVRAVPKYGARRKTQLAANGYS